MQEVQLPLFMGLPIILYFLFIGLSIYTIILFINLLRKGNKLLDLYIKSFESKDRQ
jgi:hypothetical protein